MIIRAGAHADRVQRARELLSAKSRREQGRYAFEGTTLLEEALKSNVVIEEIYATETVFESSATLAELESRSVQIVLVDDRTARKLSDLETPTGLIAITPMHYAPLGAILSGDLSLILADINDPGNAGTLLRSAEAFGASGVIFGRFGVDPYHPKVVRGSMGALFRLPVAVATPDDAEPAAVRARTTILGLAADGEPLRRDAFVPPAALVVGHERHGLGSWERLCSKRLAIPMRGPVESLNAAVAGSVALYEATR